MKDKANYKAAMADLREGCQGDQRLLLSHIDRYTGELRREKATLSRRIAELERTIAVKEGRIKKLQPLVAEVAELNKSKEKLADERDQLRIVVKEWQEIEEGTSTYINVKVKCLNCSLHFIICTWFPNTHSANTIICPECGQRKGRFLVWQDIPTNKHIFESVPGSTPPAGTNLLGDVGRASNNSIVPATLIPVELLDGLMIEVSLGEGSNSPLN